MPLFTRVVKSLLTLEYPKSIVKDFFPLEMQVSIIEIFLSLLCKTLTKQIKKSPNVP